MATLCKVNFLDKQDTWWRGRWALSHHHHHHHPVSCTPQLVWWGLFSPISVLRHAHWDMSYTQHTHTLTCCRDEHSTLLPHSPVATLLSTSYLCPAPTFAYGAFFLEYSPNVYDLGIHISERGHFSSQVIRLFRQLTYVHIILVPQTWQRKELPQLNSAFNKAVFPFLCSEHVPDGLSAQPASLCIGIDDEQLFPFTFSVGLMPLGRPFHRVDIWESYSDTTCHV